MDIMFVPTDELKTGRNNIVFSANDNQLAPLAVSYYDIKEF